MATLKASLCESSIPGLTAELSNLLQAYRNYEIVLNASHHTFRLTDLQDTDTSCEVHIANIPLNASLAQLVRLFEPQGLLLRITLFVDDDGVPIGKATAVYESEEDAMTVEDNLNGVVLSDDGPVKAVSARWGTGASLPTPELTKSKEGLIVTTEMGRRLYVANIPKIKTREEIMSFFSRALMGLVDVMLYTYPGSSHNRGFCFVEFNSSKSAMLAKESIVGARPWGCEVVVDWADPEQEPDEETMRTVKVLYIKNLSPRVTDIDLKHALEQRGVEVERIKVIRDFAFIHFANRARAEAAFDVCKTLVLDELPLQVSWAKPPVNKRMREEVLRRRERRMHRMLVSMCSGRANNGNAGQGDF